MRLAALILTSLLFPACGDSTSPAGPDAPAPAIDAPIRVAKVLYLNFEGVTLTPGPSDASANTWGSWLGPGPLPLPAYLAGMPGRDTRIAAIASETRALLAPYDVDVVLARPALPPYHMIVFTATSTATGYPGVIVGHAGDGCSTLPSSVSVEYALNDDDSGTTPVFRAKEIAMWLGVAYTVPFTTKQDDCMCLKCAAVVSPCTFGGAGTPVNTTSSCTGAPATIDEAALFAAALGQR